ncbi:MAG: sodium:proton antiporter [Candidatus Rokuibacteriota bacterium]|nr:MAG: sodium:proton antiporter [Candidatus Rokubacteria bacterium]
MPTPADLPVATVAPFAALLIAIAVCPLALPSWWHANRNKLLVSCVLAMPIVLLYLRHEPRALHHAGGEYVSFVLLLAGLYVIAGGILVRGDLRATPLTNAAFLASGAILASFIGTTGASMLLLRPLLQTNHERRRVRHTVVFFIFLVSNIGGLLTPLGDPPLFLGYLQGVPFWWTFRLWPMWLFMVGALLAVYLVWDSLEYARESPAALRLDRARIEPLRVLGALNGVWLLGVMAAVAFLGAPWRDMIIIALAAISYWLTDPKIRRANGVTAAPMIEVAVLFFGIFLPMIPALELLRAHAGRLGVREPWHFFWASGSLSSVLDNAPTYLTFFALGQGVGLAGDGVAGVPVAVLEAISLGSVMMGANTYIGNAPNFMVRAIAEESGVRMPTFVGYLAYSGLVLGPLFVALTLLFL